MIGYWNSRSAIIVCPEHGEQSLTYLQYCEQMRNAHLTWKCPICFKDSDWSDNSAIEDDYYEE